MQRAVPSAGPRVERVLAAFTGGIKRPRVSLAYRAGVLLVLMAMLVLIGIMLWAKVPSKLAGSLDARIAEIRKPGNAQFFLQSHRDQVHAVGCTCGNDCIDRIALQFFSKKFYGRLDPETSCIGNKKISPYPNAELLGEGSRFIF